MPAEDWYPSRLADRIPFHANFSTQATATGVADGLTAGQPEQREYRVQGMVANQRVGTVSPTVSAVTVP
ncbi:MAG: hypothetical protein IH851_00715 [Armatimonadetes bacterium]|nr:hypothetical protein [Armatimonadota bacterium]